MQAYRDEDVVTGHPDHVRSLFTASAEDAPSITGESPLRPIVGPNSTLTALGERHMRQRKLMLPHFHGDAVARYTEMIAAAAARELERLRAAAARAAARGLTVHAGPGLNYHNVGPIAAIPEIVELNIGHAIVAQALFDGFPTAVAKMKALMVAARS
jgi:hypothetical protein